MSDSLSEYFSEATAGMLNTPTRFEYDAET